MARAKDFGRVSPRTGAAAKIEEGRAAGAGIAALLGGVAGGIAARGARKEARRKEEADRTERADLQKAVQKRHDDNLAVSKGHLAIAEKRAAAEIEKNRLSRLKMEAEALKRTEESLEVLNRLGRGGSKQARALEQDRDRRLGGLAGFWRKITGGAQAIQEDPDQGVSDPLVLKGKIQRIDSEIQRADVELRAARSRGDGAVRRAAIDKIESLQQERDTTVRTLSDTLAAQKEAEAAKIARVRELDEARRESDKILSNADQRRKAIDEYRSSLKPEEYDAELEKSINEDGSNVGAKIRQAREDARARASEGARQADKDRENAEKQRAQDHGVALIRSEGDRLKFDTKVVRGAVDRFLLGGEKVGAVLDDMRTEVWSGKGFGKGGGSTLGKLRKSLVDIKRHGTPATAGAADRPFPRTADLRGVPTNILQGMLDDKDAWDHEKTMAKAEIQRRIPDVRESHMKASAGVTQDPEMDEIMRGSAAPLEQARPEADRLQEFQDFMDEMFESGEEDSEAVKAKIRELFGSAKAWQEAVKRAGGK